MNRPCLQGTKFVNHPQGTETYGWRLYDNHGQTYDNTLAALPDDDLELLRIALDSDDETAVDVLNFMLEHGRGIYIGDEWYEWDAIKHLWEDG